MLNKEVNFLIINRVEIQLDVSSFRSLVYSFIRSFVFFLILSFNEASVCTKVHAKTTTVVLFVLLSAYIHDSMFYGH